MRRLCRQVGKTFARGHEAKLIQRHSAHQLVVGHPAAIRQGQHIDVGVNSDHLGMEQELALVNLLIELCQMAPVPPQSGNRKVLLGPQLASSSPDRVFLVMRARSTVATRSPIHSRIHFAWVVPPHLAIVRNEKRSRMPLPKPFCSYSKKSVGAARECFFRSSSIKPSMHRWRSFCGRR